MMRVMLSLKQAPSSMARLITALFVVQLFATAFCVMLPQANAMPILAKTAMPMNHCMNNVEKDQEKKQQAVCSHCDQPDELWQANKLSLDLDPLQRTTLLYVYADIPTNNKLVIVPFPTGPPRSCSLLYTTTQRIRL